MLICTEFTSNLEKFKIRSSQVYFSTVGPISRKNRLLELLDLVTEKELDDEELFVTEIELQLLLDFVAETELDDKLWLDSDENELSDDTE